MGLDMSFYKAKPENIVKRKSKTPEIGFVNNTPYDSYDKFCNEYEIDYFRKHHRLNDWMERLYRIKGGTGEFNGQSLQINQDDVHHLKAAIKHSNLEDLEELLMWQQTIDNRTKKEYNALCRKISKCLKEGWVVYYTCSW